MTNSGEQTAEHLPDDPRRDPALGGGGGGERSLMGADDARRSGDSSAHARFVPGAMIAGRYRVVSLLGRGGMGEVYRADDLRLGQTVAIKFLPALVEKDEARLARLNQEVRLAREVAHPNVARVFDIGDFEGEHFLTMEFVDGEDLASLLRRVGRPNPDKAMEIVRQICAGVAALHERGVLHRDLKPANIMLDGRGRVRIMDFGLALRQQVDGSSVGAARSAGGTPGYMAPEQWSGGPVTEATDVYAIGLILHELFTGRSAAQGESIDAYRRWHLSTPVESVSHSLSEVNPEIERVILACIAKDPSERPASALAVSAMLPGGDPIATALAAGETPSPDMVAAAGRVDRISPTHAVILGVTLLAALLTWVVLPSPLRPWDLAPPRKPPAVLADRVDQILARLGSEERLPGRAQSFVFDESITQWLRRESGTDRDLSSAVKRADPVSFLVRRSPRAMLPLNSMTRVTLDDPAVDRAGMEVIQLFSDGRLRHFERVPARRVDALGDEAGSAPRAVASEETLAALIRDAGFDPGSLRSAEPQRRPRVFADRVLAWEEVNDDGAEPWRVEAATLEGAVVSFEVVGPWMRAGQEVGRTAPERSTRSDAPARVAGWLIFTLLLVAITVMSLLALRHLRQGRGDLRGARALALAVMGIALLRWLMLCDFVWSPTMFDRLVSAGVGLSLFAGAIAWVLYIALEPFARRVWPATMVSWQRLVRGQFRDPLVGRDLIVGAIGGVLYLLAGTAGLMVDRALGQPSVIDLSLAGAPFWLIPLMGGVRPVGIMLVAIQSGVIVPMVSLLFLVVMRMIVRRSWVAAGLFWLIYSASVLLSSPTLLSGIVFGSLVATILLILLMRYGLVAILGSQVVGSLLTLFPVTSDTGAWFFSIGLIGVVLALVLSGAGLAAAVAGRSAPAWLVARRGGAAALVPSS
ncbi:MAG: serine/threonine protein kinase [Phycisphaeraceae bacterium]|nr:serine/threonine protein kinase [Phycisphaeraceae bacterium]